LSSRRSASRNTPHPKARWLVGEVLVGIVDADGESYRAVEPGWRPTLPTAQAGRFGLADLLAVSAEVADAAA